MLAIHSCIGFLVRRISSAPDFRFTANPFYGESTPKRPVRIG